MQCICFYNLEGDTNKYTDKEIRDSIDQLLDTLNSGNHYKSDVNYAIRNVLFMNKYTYAFSIDSVDWELSGESLFRAVCNLNVVHFEEGFVESVVRNAVNMVINNVCEENGFDLNVRFVRVKLKENNVMVNNVVNKILEGNTLSEAIRLTESTIQNDKIQALLHFLGKDVDDDDNWNDVGVESYNDNVYYYKDSNNQFLVCTDDEADEEFKQSIENIVDDIGLDAFSPYARDYILENFCDDEAINDFYQDDQRSYAEDIQSESNSPQTISVENPETGENEDVEVTNRLFQECLENDIIIDDDFYTTDFDEDGEYIGDTDLVELWSEKYQTPADQGYDSGFEWLEFNFGKDFAKKFVDDNCALDYDGVAEYIKGEDGRGGELNGYDGKEYEEDVDGMTYYIYPNCDWEKLKEDGD